MRWRRSHFRHDLRPLKPITVAEESGQIEAIGVWNVNEASLATRLWRSEG